LLRIEKLSKKKTPRIKLSIQGNENASDSVVLLHGLARTRRSLNTLARSLAANYQVISVGYPSQRYSIEELAEPAINYALKHCSDSQQVHFVTHSMGGILLREYLSRHSIVNLGNTVMLAPPNQGSELIDKLHSLRLFKQYNGPAGQQLGTDANSKPNQLGNASFPLGVIAGSRALNPISSKLINQPNDGKVAISRTHLDGCQDHIVIKASHTFIMNHPDVLAETDHFLKHGVFSKNPTIKPVSADQNAPA